MRRRMNGLMAPYLIMPDPRDTVARNGSPLSIRTDPKLWMHFIFRDDFAREDVAHEEIVVHGFRNNLSYRRGVKLDERVVF